MFEKELDKCFYKLVGIVLLFNAFEKNGGRVVMGMLCNKELICLIIDVFNYK
jgi:hypothetical protein